MNDIEKQIIIRLHYGAVDLRDHPNLNKIMDDCYQAGRKSVLNRLPNEAGVKKIRTANIKKMDDFSFTCAHVHVNMFYDELKQMLMREEQ